MSILTIVTERLIKLGIGNNLNLNELLGGSLEFYSGEQVATVLLCANNSKGEDKSCENAGSMACSNCHLVKYCSKECQALHWKNHKKGCNDPQGKKTWCPAWVREHRTPAFIGGDSELPIMTTFGVPGIYLWGNVPAIDCLRISSNEGRGSKTKNFKLAFAASGDIRNLVQTVNGLPSDYSGKCDIIVNDMNPIVVGRNIMILYSLLCTRYTLEERAELALHLMYSAALPPRIAAYCYRTVGIIYHGCDQNMGFVHEATFKTTGKGSVHLAQPLDDAKIPISGFLSDFNLPRALKNMREMMLNPSRVDYMDRYLVGLEPAHRVSVMHFRKSGVLAPFSANLSRFTQPNRLFFSPTGDWLMMDSEHPLQSWDMTEVLASGKRHGVDRSDAYGCLFFHVKDQFREFARRVQDFNINIHLTQLPATMLSQAITDNVLPPFHKNCFDRVETSNMADTLGMEQVLEDWGPLLNRDNKHASLLIYFMNWCMKLPVPIMPTPDAVERVWELEGLSRDSKPNLDLLSSTALMRVVNKLSVAQDYDKPFQEYLQRERTDRTADRLGLRVRFPNRIHSKRHGIPLNNQKLRRPNCSKEEYYGHACLGGNVFSTCFVEVECV